MSKLLIFQSETTDPWFNLATEDWLFKTYGDVHHVLYLWRNDKTVVIGRAQNPWIECHLDAMAKKQVKLARRQSGGGTVFHDLGNTNFTFISPQSDYDKKANLKIICQALHSLNVNAYPSGRNDILVDDIEGPRKISGSAFRETKTKCFHHGTLLINANLEELSHYLNPSKKKLEAKGVKSVRSRVLNVQALNPQITHLTFCQAVIKAFEGFYQQKAVGGVKLLSHSDLSTIETLKQQYEILQSVQWQYGKTLPFTHELHNRFTWGEVRFHLVVKNAYIEDAICYTDCLTPEPLLAFAEMLKSSAYDKTTVDIKIEQSLLDAETKQDLSSWLLEEIPVRP